MGFFSSNAPAPAPAPLPTGGPSIDAPIAEPKSQTTPVAHTLAEDHRFKVDTIIDTLSTPEYSLPLTLKDLKAFWKLRAKVNAASGTSTPVSSPASTRTHFREGTEASVATSAASEHLTLEPLSEREKFWLTTEQIQRCLRATKWDVKRGLERIEETLVWRREYGTEDLTAKDVWVENETGKQYIYGYDKDSRPIHYMHPDRQNTKTSPEQIKHVVYQLERTVDLMPPGVENLCLCIDFGASQGGGQPTSVGQARTVLHILQTYYCERLGRAVCANVPAVFTAFYSILRPFIDPVTKDKIRFVKDVSEVHSLIDDEYLTTTHFGARQDRYYNRHEQYFTALDELCRQRRTANFERWQKLCGSQIGASELIIKGGDSPKPDASLPAKQEPPSTQIPSTERAASVAPPEPNVVDAPSASDAQVHKARSDDRLEQEATASVQALRL